MDEVIDTRVTNLQDLILLQWRAAGQLPRSARDTPVVEQGYWVKKDVKRPRSNYKQFQRVDGDAKAAPLTATSSPMHFCVPARTDARLLEACPYKSSCSPPTSCPNGDVWSLKPGAWEMSPNDPMGAERNMTYGDTHTMSTLHTRCCNMTTILHSTSHVSQAFEEYPDDADMPGARPCRNNWLSKPRMVGCGRACACSRLTDPCFL